MFPLTHPVYTLEPNRSTDTQNQEFENFRSDPQLLFRVYSRLCIQTLLRRELGYLSSMCLFYHAYITDREYEITVQKSNSHA